MTECPLHLEALAARVRADAGDEFVIVEARVPRVTPIRRSWYRVPSTST